MGVMDWIGFVTGVICVWLIVREQDINWPIGLLNSIALLIVFWRQKIYAQAGLQAFYILESAYGWWLWTRVDQANGFKVVRIGRTKRQAILILLAITLIGTAGLWPLFRSTGDPSPFWDSLAAVMSLVAEYMLCLKFIEAWSVYLAADLISLVMFALLGIWITFGTYLCFTVLCVIGIIEWKKRMAKNSATALSLESSTP